MSQFIYADDNKRYHTWNYFLRHHFGGKVCKVPLNARFTCPNIDGSKGVGGCTYCSSAGSGDFAGNPLLPLDQQFAQVAEVMRRKWPDAKYIAYFQAHTNTYAPLPHLRALFTQALQFPNVVGLSIATRADCITEPIADLLAELSQQTFLNVELGLQSTYEETARRINRCHSYEEFLQGYTLLQQRDIPLCIHLINGLPGETHEMMVENVKRIVPLQPHSIKLHLLHLLEHTVMAEQWRQGEFALLSLEDYVQIVCDQLEWIPPSIILQRLTGDGDPKQLLGPMWSLKKFVVLNEIDKEMVRRNSYQGIRVTEEERSCSLF